MIDGCCPTRDTVDRVAAILGAALGIGFVVCFLTGLLSHAIQHPPSWFSWRTRPAGLYRVTQGLHVATGIATIPLLFAKLWSVFPRLFQWPVATSVLTAVERLSLLPLVGGSLFMLITGLANTELWYPWVFFFPAGHYTVSFVVMGALLIHLVAKWAATRRVLFHSGRSQHDEVAFAQGRRRFLGTVGAVSAGAVIVTVGQTVSPLRRLALLAPRHPDIGVQGFPVNKSAREAGVTQTAADASFTLTVEAGGKALHVFTLEELHAMATRTATLPIACVEGWSANRTWRGVPVRDVLDQAGVPDHRSVSVESLQRGGRYRRSILTSGQIDDAETMLAIEVDGDPLHLDHGFPLRLISPNRPGVLQTKWVGKLVVQMMSETEDERPPAWLFVPTLVVGWAIIAFGAHAALRNARDAHPFALLVHVVTFDLVHDIVIAPALFLVAWSIGKVAPPVAHGPVRAAAAATALYIAIAYPLIHRWGRRPTNSSTLPLNYGRNLTIVIATVWLLAGVVIIRRVRAGRRG